jgi:hypothetical protein
MPDRSRTRGSVALDRERVLAYRAAAHDLTAPGTGAVVLAVGLQDYPPGRSAAPALALRTAGRLPDAGVALVHSTRGALHLHRTDDLAVLRAALHVDDPRDWSPQAIGPFGAELTAAGLSFGAAVDEVAAAMARVLAGGRTLAKGALSAAVSPAVDHRLAPWCGNCGAAHVQDLLFRLATLHAGLTVQVERTGDRQLRYRAAASPSADGPAATVEAARAELVRRFLTAFGPAAPGHLAAWLGLRPAAARRWWDLVAGELRPARVAGKDRWVPAVDPLRDAPPARGVRLLPGYDPLTELADRELLVAEPDRRRKVWQPAASPGVVWVDGEIAGVWRGRVRGTRLTVTVEPFGPLTPEQLRAAEPDLAVIAAAAGAAAAELTTGAP